MHEKCASCTYLPMFFILIFASGGISSGSLCKAEECEVNFHVFLTWLLNDTNSTLHTKTYIVVVIKDRCHVCFFCGERRYWLFGFLGHKWKINIFFIKGKNQNMLCLSNSFRITQHTHCYSKFDWYGICLLPHLAAHVKAYLGDFARSGWSSWGLSLILRHEMLGSAFDSSSPLSSHSATRDRLSFHSAILLLRPCLRQDNSPRWTTVFWHLDK